MFFYVPFVHHQTIEIVLSIIHEFYNFEAFSQNYQYIRNENNRFIVK